MSPFSLIACIIWAIFVMLYPYNMIFECKSKGTNNDNIVAFFQNFNKNIFYFPFFHIRIIMIE